MDPERFPYDALPPVPVKYGLSVIISSVIGFHILNEIVVKVGVPNTVEAKDTWKYRNLVISWIHALVVGVWDLTCFILYPELTTDLIAFHNHYIYFLVAISCGYFIYDFMDMMRSNQLVRMWEVSLHHVAVTSVFVYNVLESRYLAYTVIALLTEVNSVFLHSRKLLQMRKWPFDHWLYRVNNWVNLLTFLPCRFGAVAWISYGMMKYYYRFTVFYWITLAVTMFIMWIIYFILFWRLLKNDVLRSGKKSTGRGVSDSTKNQSLISNNNEPQLTTSNGTMHKIN